MRNEIKSLILIFFFACGVSCAQAETTSIPQKKDTFATMNDAALASYISGKLEPLLKDTGHAVSTDVCDQSGCAVVVQPRNGQ